MSYLPVSVLGRRTTVIDVVCDVGVMGSTSRKPERFPAGGVAHVTVPSAL
jgi:hypothetical protein